MIEEDLKKAIQDRVLREKEKLLNQAREEAQKILDLAKDEAATLRQTHLTEIEKNYLFKKTKELNLLIQETKKNLLEKKEEKINNVFSYVKENLKLIHQDKAHYKYIFRKFLEEALGNFKKEIKLKLKVNSSDQHLASEVLGEFKLSAQLENKDSIDGGLELCDLEENVVILNTFSSRLEKLSFKLRQEVNKILFG